jgi:hypothetical protein
MTLGYVYVLTNPVMPSLVKIGSTKGSPYQRAEDLSRATGVPLPFKVAMYAQFNGHQEAERWIHSRMSGYRLSGRREFFVDALYEAACWIYHHPDRKAFAAAPTVLEDLEIETFDDVLNPWRCVL